MFLKSFHVVLNIQKPTRLGSISDFINGVRFNGGRIGIERNILGRESICVVDVDLVSFFMNVLINKMTVLRIRRRCGGGVIVMSEGLEGENRITKG